MEQLEKLGRTIAVIPSAIDEIVPNGNKKLAEQILKTGGCIISEYEPRVGMAKWHFVARNRIIAGLSPATVVIEAPAGSAPKVFDVFLRYISKVIYCPFSGEVSPEATVELSISSVLI